MLRRILGAVARRGEVHNPAAGRVAAERCVAHARVAEIPAPVRVAPDDGAGVAEAIRWRQRHGANPEVFLFGVFGYLRESKRLMTVLTAFRELHRANPRTALLVAGEFVSTDLERAAAPLLGGPGIIRLPHLAEREFRLAASAVDACINLRYPAAGESSGIAIRLMGLGKPVLMTDSLECSRLPEGSCMRIVAGAAELESLLEHMAVVASMPETAAAIGERAAAHIPVSRARHTEGSGAVLGSAARGLLFGQLTLLGFDFANQRRRGVALVNRFFERPHGSGREVFFGDGHPSEARIGRIREFEGHHCLDDGVRGGVTQIAHHHSVVEMRLR